MNKPIPYRKYIQENFLIDKANTGQLVPFIFNEVQNKYYDDLVEKYDIENKGINVPVRENILKARREGFSSLILALFAADDIKQDNPTQTDVLSYKEDATKTFRKRYRTYVLSAALKKAKYTTEQIQTNINLLEEIAPHVFSIDSDELELKHNKALFQCNTASARVGGRGGVRHKILFSEIAFYPDTEKMLAAEMIEATMRQVDLAGGWIFAESTENGMGTYQHKMWTEAQKGRSRFTNRFYGAGEFYSEEQIATIKSEYIDMDSFRRDYPMTEDDLFKGSAKQFVKEKDMEALVNNKNAKKELVFKMGLLGDNYIDQAETIKTQLEMIERAYAGFSLYAGLDTAKNIDATTLHVLKDKQRSVKGGLKILAIDVTNGEFMADWFEKNTNWYIERIKFSRSSKSLMYTNLQIVIADELTSLPPSKIEKEYVSDEDKHFWDQMINLEKETIGNLLVVAHPSGACNRNDHNYDDCVYHDDHPDAWMLAEYGYVIINGVPARDKKPQALTIPNSIQKLIDKGTIHDKNRSFGKIDLDYQ